MIEIKTRKIEESDRAKIIEVESKSTPNLRYVPYVFDQFLADERGEFIAAEIDEEVVGCAKLSATPNNSAWLETLRVIPERQGLGVGKRLYKRFFEVADREGIQTMRMYTGINNAVSKGLAEQAGFELEEIFCGTFLPIDTTEMTDMAVIETASSFEQVTDQLKAADLLLACGAAWNNFLVFNRTFYKLTPELCAYLAARGEVYEEPISGSVVVLGARFMPEQALHLAFFSGDVDACLHFAKEQAIERNVGLINCLFPISADSTLKALTDYGFQQTPAAFIVMKAKL